MAFRSTTGKEVKSEEPSIPNIFSGFLYKSTASTDVCRAGSGPGVRAVCPGKLGASTGRGVVATQVTHLQNRTSGLVRTRQD